MRPYRCYFLNRQSAIAGVELIEAETDDEALRRGEAVYREKGAQFSGFEVWDCGRRIHQRPEAAYSEGLIAAGVARP